MVVSKDTREIIRWAKAHSDWVNAGTGGQNEPYVSCHPCDGPVANGEDTLIDFDVVLFRNTNAGLDPNVHDDDVVGYMETTYDDQTVYYAVTPYLDDKIGTIKIYHGTGAAIPKSGAICDGAGGTPDLRGRFVVGYDDRVSPPAHSDTGYAILNATGGSKSHAHTDHIYTGSNDRSAGSDNKSTLQSHAATEHRPPWYVLAYI